MSVFKNLSRRVRQPFHARYAFRRLQEYHAAPRSLAEVVDWAMHFGGGGWMRVKTLQLPSEITRLAEAVAAIKPRIILEIGTASGGTALIWAALASERVISCDLIDMSRQRPLFSRFPPPGSSCRVILLSGNSHDPSFRERVAGELAGYQVDFLFIDGDHTEAGVTADYEDYRGFVRPGGLIAFHDILENQPLPTNQVYHLWKRLKQRAPTEEFVTEGNQSGFGIGLLHVPEQGAPTVAGVPE
ncbi:class I SAM-dependent methyltransferase [Desulfofustis glycolicus]|uniref:Cephalosporin hydroxylase n=1 Tax=Desulfofustis glycolicus DSM 9705 TaxID=1121409 RepID=A0A1M5V8H1_9BACT|nr:class I SAM-dependent methyltransferase [Desulfofustis glycolicus]MCB2214906.1 class I SAM-dependent methyltransferase [Desulfobulbaceae bacterium]SHH71511.1 Cephalosporin hydroxylase [Desulfofustis glycolicus DSM 9705]